MVLRSTPCGVGAAGGGRRLGRQPGGGEAEADEERQQADGQEPGEACVGMGGSCFFLAGFAGWFRCGRRPVGRAAALPWTSPRRKRRPSLC